MLLDTEIRKVGFSRVVGILFVTRLATENLATKRFGKWRMNIIAAGIGGMITTNGS